VRHANDSPSPNAYSPAYKRNVPAGKILGGGTRYIQSIVDAGMREGASPGPAMYPRPQAASPPCMRIAKSHIPGYFEKISKEASGKPAPGEHFVDRPENAGARWGMRSTDRYFEGFIKSKQGVPAPWDYVHERPTTQKGRWSKGRNKTSLESSMENAARIPAPGQYVVSDTSKVQGGRLPAGKLIGHLDLMLQRTMETPGPTNYSIESAYEQSSWANKGGGQYVPFKPQRPRPNTVATERPAEMAVEDIQSSLGSLLSRYSDQLRTKYVHRSSQGRALHPTGHVLSDFSQGLPERLQRPQRLLPG